MEQERKILVWSINTGDTITSNFHVVDLELDKIDENCFPSLIHIKNWGSMISSDSALYILGGDSDFDYKPEPRSPVVYRGGVRLDMGLSPHRWTHAPAPSQPQSLPELAVFKESIYTFGMIRLKQPKVFNPDEGRWRLSSPLPLHLKGCKLSPCVLTDITKNRFLLHLSGGGLDHSPSLYAFYPDRALNGTNVWDCVAPDFQQWYHIAAVCDGVIYFHDREKYRDSILGAYDLENRDWLDVEWDSPFQHHVDRDVAHTEFDALLSLGPQTLCLACWNHLYPVDTRQCRVIFLKFRADRVGSRIRFTPLTTHSFDLRSTYSVEHFVLA